MNETSLKINKINIQSPHLLPFLDLHSKTPDVLRTGRPAQPPPSVGDGTFVRKVDLQLTGRSADQDRILFRSVRKACSPVLAKVTRWRVMRSWNFLSPSESGFPRTDSRAPKKATVSRQWKAKRLGYGSRPTDVLSGPDGVCVTTYRYTGLVRASAQKHQVQYDHSKTSLKLWTFKT